MHVQSAPAVTTRTRRTLPSQARDLAGAAVLPASDSLDTVRVRDRIGRVLADRFDLSPSVLPPGQSPECGGAVVVVPASGVSSAPLMLRVPFAGKAWVALFHRTEWAPNSEDAKADLIYEIQFQGPFTGR